MYQLELWQCSSFSKDTRFYHLELCQDIFGNWVIKRTWGSAVQRDFGRSNSIICPDYQTGLLWYEKQQTRRKKRGYRCLYSNGEILDGKVTLVRPELIEAIC